MKVQIIVIAGPTCVGKTKLAIDMAKTFGGEIISADSMQVYRYMDIGTAKPTCVEKKYAKHHLIDVVNPDEDFNAAIYTTEAAKIIDRLAKEMKRIFVVGGTGLYIKALLGGLLRGPGRDNELRTLYRDYQTEYGTINLYELLKKKDENAAGKIHPNDATRIIRALEYFDKTGESIVAEQEMHGFNDNCYECMKIGLNIPRDILYDKIEKRADRMISNGLVEEVADLMGRGYDESIRPMQTMHYKYVMDLIRGRKDMAETVRLLKRDTRRYAKRQLTWFRRDDDIRWFNPGDFDPIKKSIDDYLA